MKSNYKLIGDLVERVDNRNKSGAISNLLGLSIDKKFMPSVANTIGTDLSTYKIIQKNDFAVSLMQVSRDSKIPVACQKEHEAAIMSPAYSIFRVKDTSEILPDYLEMWFNRSEFDREAAFIAVGGVRGSMPWDEFARIKVFVPTMDRQKELVRQYKTIADRIALKQKINDNLARTSKTLYKNWFVDFIPFGGRKPALWNIGTVGDIADFYDSKRRPLSGEERANMDRVYPYYGAVSIVDYVDDYLFDGEYILLSEDGIYVVDENGHPLLQYVTGKFWANNHAHVLKGKNNFSEDSLYLFLDNMNMAPIVTGAAQPKINQANLRNFPVIIPDSITMTKFNRIVAPIFKHQVSNNNEIIQLRTIEKLLLSRMAI